jgi:hypothetical protein
MLAEVLTALALLAVGLSALASAIPVAGTAVSEGADLSTATFLAAARLEEVRAAAWSAAPPVDRLGVSGAPFSAPQSGSVTTFADEASLPDPYSRYRRQTRILDCGLPPGCGAVMSARLRQITVTVAYRPVTPSGMAVLAKAVLVTTFVAQR